MMKEIKALQQKESIRKKSLKNFKNISLLEYFQKQKEIEDDFFFFSSYQFLINQSKRKSSGAFYTPEWIVVFMVREVLNKWISNNSDLWNIRILDPSCGSGNFTQIIIKELLALFLLKYSDKTKKEILEQILSNCIFCWDIDSEALEICKRRISHCFGCGLKNIKCCNTLYAKENFDIVVGNPPYGDILSSKEKKELKESYDNIALSFLDWANSHINSNLFLNDSSILTSCLITLTILITPFFERLFSKQEKNQS